LRNKSATRIILQKILRQKSNYGDGRICSWKETLVFIPSFLDIMQYLNAKEKAIHPKAVE
jgi:hypothetical protein